MVRLPSESIVKLLSRTGKLKLDLQASFDFPDSLWHRMRNQVSNYRGTRSSMSPSYKLLRELFEAKAGPRQRAILGSLLSDYDMVLPLHLDIRYIRSLMDAGKKFEALQRWRKRRLSGNDNSARWLNIGAQCFCQCNLVVAAEKIASSGATYLDSDLCLAFVNAYALLRQPDNVDVWSKRVFAANPSTADANRALRLVITAKMWPQVQTIVKTMSERGMQVETELIAKCVRSVWDGAGTKELARLLAEDGSLVNSQSFRNVLGADARAGLNKLLRSHDKVAEAQEFVLNYSGPLSVSLCYQMLQYHKNAARLGEKIPEHDKWLADLLAKVRSSEVKDSMYVQFMLSYFQLTRNYTILWRFTSELRLFTTKPKVVGQLSYSNYLLMWRVLYEWLAPAAETSVSTSDLPISLRQFILVTMTQSTLTSSVLKLIISCLNTMPDVPAIVALIEFAGANYGIHLSDQDLANVLGKAGTSNDPEKIVTSKRAATKLCELYHLEPSLIHDQSRVFCGTLDTLCGGGALKSVSNS